ncbi:MAG: DUF6702 family protein [bacterium]
MNIVAVLKRLRVAMALLTLVPQLALAHPLHSTITELTEDRSRGVVRATIRVFADDFGTAVSRSTHGRAVPTGPQWDAAAFAYVASVFGFTDRAGHALPLRSCGTKRTGDLLWICVEATSGTGLSQLQVRNAVLCNLFDDQVNVVQAAVGSARRSLLFTRGDRFKPLA